MTKNDYAMPDGRRAAPSDDLRLSWLAIDAPDRAERLRQAAFAVLAVLLHAGVFTIVFPQLDQATPIGPVIERWVPPLRRTPLPPPPVRDEPPLEAPVWLPVPIPDPDPPEVEIAVDLAPESAPTNDLNAISVVVLDQATPDALDPPGPILPHVDGVGEPRLIAESRIEPQYPSIARRARIGWRVVLRAVISRTGDVVNIDVLSEQPRRFGFAQAAIEAVSRWRYHPARQNGRAVDVYSTVVVRFTLD